MSHVLLRKLRNFVRLSDEDGELVETHAQRIRTFEARDDLIGDGEDPRYVNLILEGWACRSKHFPDGRRQIVSFFVPGDMCDPVVFLLDQMSHALTALTPIKVARVNRDEMNDLMTRSPTLARAFWLDMLISAEIQREWTISLGRRTATERMAHLFCELPLRLKGVGLSNGIECELPITQADLGDALGLSTVHINRTLQELRSRRLVELRSRKLTILDEAGLRTLAVFDPAYLHRPHAEL